MARMRRQIPPPTTPPTAGLASAFGSLVPTVHQTTLDKNARVDFHRLLEWGKEECIKIDRNL
jgi:hypothetical protein